MSSHPLHPQAQAVIDLIESFGDPPLEQQSPEQARALRRGRLAPPTETILHTVPVDLRGVPGRLYRPTDEANQPVLVYFHGGGWVLGDLDSHDNVCRALANRANVTVISVAYRLAPEHPFPAAVDDAISATRWVHEHAGELGVDGNRLAVGGDSAGGNLAAIVAIADVAPVMFQLLIYPAVDARVRDIDHASYVENADGPFLTAVGMRWFYDHYVPQSIDRSDPRLSPLLADDATLASAPPAFVLTASHDPLRDEGVAYAERLIRLGVRVTHAHYQGVFHGFFNMADSIDLSKDALDEAAAAIRIGLTPRSRR